MKIIILMKIRMSTHEKWIRIFDIPEISEHKNGFTIYKIVSMLYKESFPDAVTKVTVWKRFNDFKKLHRVLRILHKKLKLKTKYPSLPSKTLFKRFDSETICNRKESILKFLDFVGSNQQLFTSNEFTKFLETSHTPREQLNSNINLIRADLNLPEDPELCININSSDDDRTLSDSDSIGSSIALSMQNESFSDSHTKLRKLHSSTSINSQSSKNSDSLSMSTTLDNMAFDAHMYFKPANSSGYGFTDDEVIQYIMDANLHINMAVELENSKKYEEAFTAYKTAIDILVKYSKDDPDYDRRQMVRYKSDKYLIKAEKIYNMYLAPEVKNLQLLTEAEEMQQAPLKMPLFDLYKFKVVKIIASGMLALHSELQQLFFIKVIHKNSQFLNENLILPENVPYMVKLHSHYNCENALFLVLEYCSGTKLTDFLKTHSSNTEDNASINNERRIFQEIEEISDNDSERSFSDLINEYSNSRYKNGKDLRPNINNDQVDTSDDDSFEKIDMSDVNFLNKKSSNIMNEPLKLSEDKTLTETQSNLSQCTINQDIIKQKFTKKKIKEIDKIPFERSESIKTERSLSQVSSLELEDLNGSFVLPQEIVLKWAVQLLLALEKLHTLGIICRDLQTKNILIDDKDNLVLTYMCNVKDFGDIFCDGVNYNLAPEIYSFQEVTLSADWWCYGAILYELLVGVPLSDVHPNGITNFTFLKIPKYVSPEGRSILKQLLQYEPNDRLGSRTNGIESIKSHPFFHSISWEYFTTFQ